MNSALLEINWMNPMLAGIFIIGIYHLIISASSKDGSFFYFGIYLIFFLSATVVSPTFGNDFQWIPKEGIRFFPLFVGGAIWGLISFTQALLYTEKLTTFLHKSFSYFKYFILSLAFIGFTIEPVSLQSLLTTLYAPFSLFFFLIGGIFIVKGHYPARFFTMAWGGFFVFWGIEYLQLPHNIVLALGDHSIFYGMVANAVLLAFSLIDYTKFRQNEKEEAQQKEQNLWRAKATEQAQMLKQSLEDTRIKRQEIAHINQMVYAVNATLDVDEVMTALIEVLRDLFHFNQISLMLVNQTGDMLTLHNMYGAEVPENTLKLFKKIQIPFLDKDNFFIKSLLTKKVGYVSPIEAQLAESFSDFEKMLYYANPTKSFLYYPVSVQKKPIGVIAFANTIESFDLNEEQIKKIGNYVAQISTAIQNARLYEKEQEQQKALKSTMTELQKKGSQVESELDLAARIQEGTLPPMPFQFKKLRMTTFYKAMEKVGGDVFNIFPMKNGSLGVLIADAMGHGIPAAFVTMMAQIVFNNIVQDHESPKTMMRQINKIMGKVLVNNEFVTAFFLVISQKYEIVYANANHPAPMVLRKGSDTIETWHTKGMFLGFFNDREVGKRYQEKVDTLVPGDRVFLYTDGLTEVRNKDKELFGDEQLQRLLLKTRHLSLEETKAQILKEWRAYFRGEPVKDDVTFIIFEIQPD